MDLRLSSGIGTNHIIIRAQDQEVLDIHQGVDLRIVERLRNLAWPAILPSLVVERKFVIILREYCNDIVGGSVFKDARPSDLGIFPPSSALQAAVQEN